MVKEYLTGAMFYAENSCVYWWVVEVLEQPSLQTGLGGTNLSPFREYLLANEHEEEIILSGEAISFSLREIPDVPLEFQTLEVSVKGSSDIQRLRELNLVTLAMKKAAMRRVA